MQSLRLWVTPGWASEHRPKHKGWGWGGKQVSLFMGCRLTQKQPGTQWELLSLSSTSWALIMLS